MKKRLCSLMLVCVLLLCALPLAALAGGTVPVIVIGGYSSPQIYLFDDEGNIQEKVWGLSLQKALDVFKKDIPELTAANFNAMMNRDPKYIADQFSKGVLEIAQYMKRSPDGTPLFNTGTWPKSAEESNMAYINAHRADNPYLDTAVREKRFTPVLCELIGEKNVYSFSVDWRQNAIECARDLGTFIVDVRRHAGAPKVNILCESHGGETTLTYVSLCAIVQKGGEDKQKLGELLALDDAKLSELFNLSYLNNVCADSPALGVQLAYDLVTGQTHFDMPRLIEYLQYANNPLQKLTGGEQYTWESDWELFVNSLSLNNLNKLVNRLIQNTEIIQIMLTFGSIWDFIPLDQYEEVKALKLTTPELRDAFAPMIAKSDYEHYTVFAHLAENLTFARSSGVNVNVIVGTDLTTVSGSRVNGDSLVATKDASRARVAGYGKRFADGYHTDYSDKAVVCTDPTHDHVSPRMNLDAAYGYLPENTFYLEEQYHAMYVTDSHCQALVLFLLLAEKPVDIYTDPRYPQFDVTHNAKMGVYAKFDNDPYGTLTKNDTALVVTNLSAKSNLELVAVKAEGAAVRVKDVYGKKIKLGQSVTLPLEGEIPDADMQHFKLTIYFLEDNSIFSMNSRTLHFTVKGGKAIPFDKENPLTNAAETPVFLTARDVLKGIRSFDFKMILKARLLSLVAFWKSIVRLVQSIGK
jgi:hypothetical protein